MFINQLIVQQGKVALLLNNDERTADYFYGRLDI